MITSDAIVTVGVPFFNAERYLLDAISSVFAQTLPNWHLILLDDGSTDGSLEIANDFASDSRVTVIHGEINLGLAARLNQIADIATTPFTARMDADDLMATSRLEIQLDFLNLHPNFDLTATGMISMSDTCKYQGKRLSYWTSASTYSILTHKTGIAHATVLGRTEWFRRNRYRTDFERAEDIELWLRTNRSNDLRVSLIEEYLYYYREFDSTTPKKVRASLSSIRKLAKLYSMSLRDQLKLKLRLSTISLLTYVNASTGIRKLLVARRNDTLNSSGERELFSRNLAAIEQVRSQFKPRGLR